MQRTLCKNLKTQMRATLDQLPSLRPPVIRGLVEKSDKEQVTTMAGTSAVAAAASQRCGSLISRYGADALARYPIYAAPEHETVVAPRGNLV